MKAGSCSASADAEAPSSISTYVHVRGHQKLVKRPSALPHTFSLNVASDVIMSMSMCVVMGRSAITPETVSGRSPAMSV